MRRWRFSRVFASFLLLVVGFVFLGISAFMRVSLRFGIESHLYRYPPSSLTFDRDGKPDTSGALYPNRPWFMKGGLLRPTNLKRGQRPRLWPHEDPGDRIVEQLMYVPHDYGRYSNSSSVHLKKILLYFGRNGWSDLPLGRYVFLRDECPVNTCELTATQEQAPTADLILFKDRFSKPKHRRSPSQVWMLFLLECPQHTQNFGHLAGLFNWTATYRHDSDIVAPYEKFVSYPEQETIRPTKNYAFGKTKKVAMLVSNCVSRNRRLQYARELSKHIEVDIFGKCGKKKCPKSNANYCFRLLKKDYKFYLAFENSNCKDYITEKFFVNGLSNNVLPIVMGARPEDYERSAPPNSYIHVEEFPGPEALAEYLHVLDANDTLYNTYFEWKTTGEFINTRFWCRLCALLHAPTVPKVYTDLQEWWASKNTCTKDRWKRPYTSGEVVSSEEQKS